MKIISYVFAGILGIAIASVVCAHGGGGGTKMYEADTPKLDFRKRSLPFSIPDENATPSMEMSVVDKTIRISIKDSYGDPVSITGAEAKAFVSTGGKTTIVRLLPTLGNALSGTGDFVSQRDMRVDLTLRLVGERAINKTFYPMR